MKTIKALQHLKQKLGNKVASETDFLGEKTLEVSQRHLKEVLAFLKRSPFPGYEVLMDLTGVDYLVPVKKTKVVYWLHNPSTFDRLRVVAYATHHDFLPSVADLWENAKQHEKEIFDLFGILFAGNPHMPSMHMKDQWTGQALEPDYALTEEL